MNIQIWIVSQLIILHSNNLKNYYTRWYYFKRIQNSIKEKRVEERIKRKWWWSLLKRQDISFYVYTILRKKCHVFVILQQRYVIFHLKKWQRCIVLHVYKVKTWFFHLFSLSKLTDKFFCFLIYIYIYYTYTADAETIIYTFTK